LSDEIVFSTEPIPKFQLSTYPSKPGIVESPINIANAILIAARHLSPFLTANESVG